MGVPIMQAAFDPAPGSGYTTRMQTWTVYLLRCADNTLYCGITNDLERRLAQHNAGTASKYTRSRIPVVLETSVEVENKSEALKLEIKVKKQPKRNKRTFLENSRDTQACHPIHT